MTDKGIYAIADVGSNTVKCTVFRVSDEVEELSVMSEKLGLITRIEDSRLPPDAIGSLCDTLAGFKRAAESLGCVRFAAFATASLRSVANFEEINSAVIRATGERIILLSAEDEARVSFAGFRSCEKKAERGIMADMGGGSTELVLFSGNEILRYHSLGFGCLSLYKRFVSGEVPSVDELSAVTEFVRGEVISSKFDGIGGLLCMVGGTGKAIGKLMREFGVGMGRSFAPKKLKVLLDRFSPLSDEDKDRIAKLLPARKETVIPGLCAYYAIADTIGADRVRISKGGLREGALRLLDQLTNE